MAIRTSIPETSEARAPILGAPAGRGASALVLPLLVVALAFGLRCWHLGTPPQTIGDESYYALDASAYLGGTLPFPGVPSGAIAGERSWVHPPLGKELIALGEGPIGFTPFGWRLPSAIAGTIGVWLVYLIGRRLWGSPWWAALASGLTALDGLHIVQSRLAMLDVFAGTFALAGIYFVVRDRTGGPRIGRSPSGVTARAAASATRWFGTTSRFWAGLMLGCAVAVKWSGVPFLILGAALAAVWVRRGTVPAGSRPVRALVMSFGVLPAAVYALAYLPFWVAHGPDFAGFLRLQAEMLRYHLGYDRPQPDASSPADWLLLTRPIRYFPIGVRGSVSSPRILALGSPVVWWGSVAAAPFVAWQGRRPQAWAERVILLGFAVAYVPWLFVSRQTFLFYMTPAVPFMSLTLVAGVRCAPGRIRTGIGVAVAAAGGVVAALLMPLWLGLRVGPGWMHAASWFPAWR
jgi:dolichyl-phosphate-mannose-protein mannosyltransferase